MRSIARAPRTQLALIALAIVGALLVIVMTLAAAEPTSAQTSRSPEELRVEKPGTGRTGPLSATQKLAISQGYLVPDQDAYERAKAEAAARAGQISAEGVSAQAALAPQTSQSFEGIRDTNVAPSDSTGAIGIDRYIELVNTKYAIYNRTDHSLIGQGTLNALVGEDPYPAADVFDPQIIWDPTTSRFYYATVDVRSATNNRLAWGFSTDSSPDSAADFCKYTIPYGSEFPDYPKLGDTSDLLLIGTNTFDRFERYLGSDLVSVTKPPAGTITTCPDPDTFTVDKEQDLRNANGTKAWTPVPANQADTNQSSTSTTGHVVATSFRLPAGFLSIYEVSKNPDGTMNLSAAENLVVPKYDFPAYAPQRGTKKRLDTQDARNTQAVSDVDPTRGTGGSVALWTQHTVFGGAGAVVRWYEIEPSGPSLFQRGTVSGGRRYIFNGAISPDRQTANGVTGLFGDSMVLGFNSSSAKRFPDIRMVSKIGNDPVSGQVLIKSSPAALTGSADCNGRICRWGDYSAATPDPAATGTHGQVWLTIQWVRPSGSSSAGWGTWNWVASP